LSTFSPKKTTVATKTPMKIKFDDFKSFAMKQLFHDFHCKKN